MKTAGIRRPALLLLAVTAAMLSLGVASPLSSQKGGKTGFGAAPAGRPEQHPEEHTTENPPQLKHDAAVSKTSNSKSRGSVPVSGSHVDGVPALKQEERTESTLSPKPAAESNPIKSGESAPAPGSRVDGWKVDHKDNSSTGKPENHTGVHPREGFVGGTERPHGSEDHAYDPLRKTTEAPTESANKEEQKRRQVREVRRTEDGQHDKGGHGRNHTEGHEDHTGKPWTRKPSNHTAMWNNAREGGDQSRRVPSGAGRRSREAEHARPSRRPHDHTEDPLDLHHTTEAHPRDGVQPKDAPPSGHSDALDSRHRP